MKKNKIAVAVSFVALISSMGAVADIGNSDSFTASFIVDEDITINGLQDVSLSSENVFDADGDARGSTPFCVGRGNGQDGQLDFEIRVSSNNNYQLRQGNQPALEYELYHTVDETFNRSRLIDTDNFKIPGTAKLSVAECESGVTQGQETGFMWVSVPAASQVVATSGTYTDVVTLTVLPVDLQVGP